jgi:hypothetical protein
MQCSVLDLILPSACPGEFINVFVQQALLLLLTLQCFALVILQL